MADERRYGEDEVSEIFALATRESGGSLPTRSEPREGLTLGELQAVGHEVGLAPERVAEAAAAIDARAHTLPRRTLLGAPLSVGRIVPLPREATDREWQFLLAELRETFGAKGKVSSGAGVREWSNGNLHAVLEETEAGHRLRLGTRKGNAVELGIMGSVFLLMSLLMLVAMVTTGKIADGFFIPAFFGLAGATTLTVNVLRLPRWADERERQMEHIAERARQLIQTPPEEDDPPQD